MQRPKPQLVEGLDHRLAWLPQLGERARWDVLVIGLGVLFLLLCLVPVPLGVVLAVLAAWILLWLRIGRLRVGLRVCASHLDLWWERPIGPPRRERVPLEAIQRIEVRRSPDGPRLHVARRGAAPLSLGASRGLHLLETLAQDVRTLQRRRAGAATASPPGQDRQALEALARQIRRPEVPQR